VRRLEILNFGQFRIIVALFVQRPDDERHHRAGDHHNGRADDFTVTVEKSGDDSGNKRAYGT